MSFAGPSAHRCLCFGEEDGPNGSYYPCPPELCEADAILERAEAAEAEVTRLTNKLNEDSQNFEIECLKAERDRLEYRVKAAEAEAEQLREEREGYKRDFLAALERSAIQETRLRTLQEAVSEYIAYPTLAGRRERLELILADLNPDGGSKGFSGGAYLDDVRALIAERDNALRLAGSDYEECATERDIAPERAEAAEAEVQRYREGLREAVDMIRFPCAECKPFIDKARALLADSPDGPKPEGGEA